MTMVVDLVALVPSRPRFMGFTQGRSFCYRGTGFDGQRFTGLFAVAGGQEASLRVELPGSHVAGLDASGASLWLIVAGAGVAHPLLAEVSLGL
jgi:hypothetical protein